MILHSISYLNGIDEIKKKYEATLAKKPDLNWEEEFILRAIIEKCDKLLSEVEK